MSANHKPASPLPWQDHSGQGEGRIGTNYGRFDAPSVPDAAYIVHAANSYPKLVEALRWSLAAANHDQINSEYGDKMRALMMELGE